MTDVHHYIPAASATVPPDCAPYVHAVVPLGDGTFLWKLHHADPALGADKDGRLTRVLPGPVAKHATGPALGSEAAAELIAKCAIAAADDAALAEIAEAMQVDISERSRSEARAVLSARVAVAGVEVAPWDVVQVSQPELADAVLAEIGRRVDADPAYRVDYEAAVKVVAAAKLVDAGAVEEVGP